MLRRNWFLVVTSVVLAAVGLLVSQLSTPSAALGYLVAWFGVVFAPTFFLRNSFPRATPVTFRAAATGLTVDGHADVRSEDVLEAKVISRSRDATVELALRDGTTLALRMAPHDARALVALLGARRTRFRLLVSFGRRLLISLGVIAVLSLVLVRSFEVWLVTLPGCFLWALLIGWLSGFVRGRLVVGADGFTTRWLFRERFIAFRDVTAVKSTLRLGDRNTPDTVIELTSGRRVRLRTVEAPNTEEERGAESRAMLAHVHEAFERSARLLHASVDIPTLVERGSRSAREWLSGLDALVRGGGSRYRVAAVSPEMLADLASDPSATIESRVGAAAALVRMDDEQLRTRVRVAAEGCAESELRDTLLALSEARDDTSTEAALASLRR